MATYDSLQQRIYRLLSDPAAARYGDELIYDGVVAAHEAILPWVPKFMSITVTAGSDGQTITLPSDVYAVQALRRVENGAFIRKANMAPGTVRHTDLDQAIDWIEYPAGYLNLSPDVDAGEEFILYYHAYWNIPASASDTSFVLEVPRCAHQGLIFYACAVALTPSSVNSASIRQFNLRIDSGTPEDNPLKAEADYMLKRFYQEMKMMPPFTKVTI